MAACSTGVVLPNRRPLNVFTIRPLTTLALAAEKLDEDEKADIGSTDTLGGSQRVNIISESGLYTLILRSRDAVTAGTPAHRFRKWAPPDALGGGQWPHGGATPGFCRL